MNKLKFLPLAAILIIAPIISFTQSQRECYNTVSFCETQKKNGLYQKYAKFKRCF
jgi:hypothetical protein